MATENEELRKLSSEDLSRRANELRETLFQDQLKLRTGTLAAPTDRVKHRRELARVLTLITEKARSSTSAETK